MRQKDRRRCLDVVVKRGAECNTDHQLLSVKIKMRGSPFHQGRPPRKSRRYDVSKLTRSNNGGKEQSGQTLGELFQDQAAERAATSWPSDGQAGQH